MKNLVLLCTILISTSNYAQTTDLYEKCFKLAKEARFVDVRAEKFCKAASIEDVNCLQVASDWWYSPERADRICSQANTYSADCLTAAMDMWLGRNRAERMCAREEISLVAKCLKLANKTKLRRKNVELVCISPNAKTLLCLQESIDNQWSNGTTAKKCKQSYYLPFSDL